MEYGKIIKHESYFDGRLKNTKVEYSVPILVTNKNDALTEVINCLELITNGETANVTIVIKADPLTHQFKLITKSYIIDKN